MEEDQMSGSCSTYGDEKLVQNSSRRTWREETILEIICTRSIILKRVLKKCGVRS